MPKDLWKSLLFNWPPFFIGIWASLTEWWGMAAAMAFFVLLSIHASVHGLLRDQRGLNEKK